MTAFPGAEASFTGFTASHTLAADSHASQHNLEQSEITATQHKLGTGASTPTSGMLLRGNGAGTSAWAQANLTTDVTGVLPQANGGTGTTLATGTGKVVYDTSPTIATPTVSGGTFSSPTLTTPTIASFTNANHNHQNSAGGGTLGESAIDWSTFSLNMKSASNSATFNPTNTDQDIASNGVSISFTVASACNALVAVSIGASSTSDFEFQPEIRLGGSTIKAFLPAASAGNASNRAFVRGFTWVVPLTAGANTLSAGVLFSSGTGLTINANAATISAIVLGTVTA